MKEIKAVQQLKTEEVCIGGGIRGLHSIVITLDMFFAYIGSTNIV